MTDILVALILVALCCYSDFLACKRLSDGKMDIIIGEDGAVTVTDPESRITDLGSSWNEDVLLQNRKIYMNYQYPDADGNTVVVTDTLTFRNRVLDGINEYQDNNPEHYK